MTTTEPAEITPKDRLIHRDLSWVGFNERVLEEALDVSNPLLERARFLAIFANNLDEFFMVRIAGLKRLLDAGYNHPDIFGYYPQELCAEINGRVETCVNKLYDIYGGVIKRELEKEKIFFRSFAELTAEQKKFVNKFFETRIFPVVTPMAVDQGHPFPVLPSRTLAQACGLTRYDKPYLAVIPIPRVLPRVVRLPSDKEEYHFMLVEQIIAHRLDDFFRGYKIAESMLFRVIRDSELSIDEEYTPDLLKAIEAEIRKRPRAKIVRLEIHRHAPQRLLESLCQIIEFAHEDAARIDGDLDVSFLFGLAAQVARDTLRYPSFVPAKNAYENIFEKIREADFIVHLPYQSFETTSDFIRQAASDENVLGIKMTLYRANEGSRILQALAEAAKNKKQVTVLVELKARFDEEKNISWARELEDAGCHVIYGMPGIKIHSKMALIVRKEDDRIRRYVHLSTGNYNETTARVYTDLGYFTANDDFARDISDVFNVITGYSLPSRWKRIISSPHDLRQYFFELIAKEIESQKKNKNGQITAKLNSLEDPQMIEKLYEASNAGVKIRLIVRGVCCLIPGVPKMSENIKVKSIVGRFLEHSRIYIFNNNGSPQVFLASSDWMSRNFDRRIEILFEIFREDIKEHLRHIVDTCWKDTAKSRYLGPDKSYARGQEKDEKFNAQDYFLAHYSAKP